MKNKSVVTTISLLLFLFTFSANSLAVENLILKETINPDSGISYTFKKLGEKIKFVFLFSKTGKVQYYKEISNKRLAELKYIVEKKDPSYIETSSQRYFTSVGEWIAHINQYKLEDHKKEAKEILNKHQEILKGLLKEYDDTTAQWRFIKHDVDYVDIYLSTL